MDEVRDLLGNLDYRISKFQENLNKLNNAKVADKNTHLESFKHELNKADDSVTTIKNRIKSCPPDSITDLNRKSITYPSIKHYPFTSLTDICTDLADFIYLY